MPAPILPASLHATLPGAPLHRRAHRPRRRVLRRVPRASPGSRRLGPDPPGPDGDAGRADGAARPARPRPARAGAVRTVGVSRGPRRPRPLDHAAPGGAAGAVATIPGHPGAGGRRPPARVSARRAVGRAVGRPARITDRSAVPDRRDDRHQHARVLGGAAADHRLLGAIGLAARNRDVRADGRRRAARSARAPDPAGDHPVPGAAGDRLAAHPHHHAGRDRPGLRPDRAGATRWCRS